MQRFVWDERYWRLLFPSLSHSDGFDLGVLNVVIHACQSVVQRSERLEATLEEREEIFIFILNRSKPRTREVSN